MATKELTSKVWLLKGKSMVLSRLSFISADYESSFAWMNASYVYGLQIVNAHMKRALGAVTSWDVFAKSLQDHSALNVDHIASQAQSVHIAPHVHEAAGVPKNGHTLAQSHGLDKVRTEAHQVMQTVHDKLVGSHEQQHNGSTSKTTSNEQTQHEK